MTVPRKRTAAESQIEKFRRLARKLEADDDEARFDERLKKLASARKVAAGQPDRQPEKP
jgi:hypothetical protein